MYFNFKFCTVIRPDEHPFGRVFHFSTKGGFLPACLAGRRVGWHGACGGDFCVFTLFMTLNTKNWLLKHWHWLILIIVSAVFFLGTASFNYYAQPDNFIKWLSPDESANYNFAKLYAQEGRLSFFEKYNLPAADMIAPRSHLSAGGDIKPVSFLGLILIYGSIAGLTTYKVLPYLTPLFAAAGIIVYFLLIREIFGRRNAFFSALLAASLPPFIYYSARSLFHNVLFIVMLLVSLYFAVIMVKIKRPATSGGLIAKLKNSVIAVDIYAALSGIFLGLAITSRTSELIWLAPAWLALWLFNFKKIGLIKLIIFIVFLLLALAPVAYWNQVLYQSYWRGGYSEMNQSILNMAEAGAGLLKPEGMKMDLIKDNLAQIKSNFFHFGFWPVKSFKMLYFYFAAMFYWLFYPAVLGLAWFLLKVRKWRRRHWAYFTAYAIIFVILLFYYGSWDFHDNPDSKSRTIGNSYARYWLPIYLGALPLASYFFIKLTKLLRKKVLVGSGRVLILTIIFFISLKFVFAGSAEGLIQSAKKQLASRFEYDQVLGLTETRAVIITQYHDKLFFPERKVIVGLFNDDKAIKQYAILAKYLPVYYYNFTFPEKDYNYLNDKRLVKFNLRIDPVMQVTKDFTLYRLSFLSFPKPQAVGNPGESGMNKDAGFLPKIFGG